jgi:hypothetical protein
MIERFFSTTLESQLAPILVAVTALVVVIVVLTPLRVRNEEILKIPIKIIILVAGLVSLVLIVWALWVLVFLN